MKQYVDRIKSVRKNAFLKQNAVYFFGSLMAGGLNYLYYPILGHLLKLSLYGEVQALVALFLQLTIFITVLSQVTVNVAATYTDDLEKRRVTLELEKFALSLSVLIFVIGSIFSFAFASFFHFTTIWPFIVLLIAVVVTAPSSFRSGYLNGHKRFGATALYNILAAGSRVFFSVVFVLFGWGAVGAIAGLVVSQLLAFAYTAYEAKKVGFGNVEGVRYFSLPDISAILPELRYGLLMLVGSLGITLLSSIDVFVVKHYFDAQTAGRYAGVSSVARIIFFITASIAQVMLPSVKKSNIPKQNQALLVRSFILLAVIGGGVVLVFSLAPTLVMRILMGHNYIAYASLLPLLSVTMFIISALNLIIYYYIALRNYQMSVIVIIGTILVGILMAARHASPRVVVDNTIIGGVLLISLFIMWRAWSMLIPGRNRAALKD